MRLSGSFAALRMTARTGNDMGNNSNGKCKCKCNGNGNGKSKCGGSSLRSE